ncbi:MAG: AmmeMemoRadiSam system radical SAM enzyme [Treponema sp.]|jgi:pyruvate formate lyase activating enzyme|nr:AmmeMemoRadiSam system radical SAM enzyme [Treponema sp.]
MERETLFINREAGGVVKCGLCPRHCAVSSGVFGACGVRANKNGSGLLPFYGYVTALAVDPVEKKPLYHFRPGSMILSVGFAGCNLHCPFCQNWHISQSTDAPGKYMKPGELVSAALREGGEALAYTYSEPLVHAEYLLDCMALARRHGIANVLVTNGCADGEAAREILALADAANIDLKCFSADTYARVLGGNLDAVLAFIRLARATGVHVEITTLIVPGLNDSAEELDACAGFIASLGAVPWHLSAYHPDYRWNAPPTDPAFLRRVKKQAEKRLPFVYAGNIADGENNTICPRCGSTLVRRSGYRVEKPGLAPLAEGERFLRCAQCGEDGVIRG